jgi:hypothetical protein
MSDFNSSLPVRTENNGDVAIKIVDGTITSQTATVDSSGRVHVLADIRDGAGTGLTSQANGTQRALDVGINVAGVQIDPRSIRALTASDIVTAAQGAPNTVANAWPVLITDGTNSISLTTAGEVKVSVTQPLPSGTNTIGSVGVTNLPTTVDTNYGAVGASTIRTAAQIGNATGAADFGSGATSAQTLRVVVASDQVIPVVISNNVPGTDVLDYKAASAIAAAASDTHTYTISTGKVGTLQQICASGSGKIKVEFKISGVTKIVLFNSTSNPNVSYMFNNPQNYAAGTVLSMVVTNLDKQSQDLYSTFEICEV